MAAMGAGQHRVDALGRELGRAPCQPSIDVPDLGGRDRSGSNLIKRFDQSDVHEDIVATLNFRVFAEIVTAAGQYGLVWGRRPRSRGGYAGGPGRPSN
jgi:hypothetical protein